MENELDKLAAELAALPSMAKALAADDDTAGDKKVADAAAEGAAEGEADDRDKKKDAAEGDGEGGGDGEETPFGKSFSVTLEDGTVQEAFDGTEMMKALHVQVTALKAENADLRASGETFAKAMGLTGNLVKELRETVIDQATMLKALQADLTRIGGQGQGRKAVLNIHAKAPEDKAEVTPPNREEIMTKALSLVGVKDGFTAADVSQLATRFDRGLPLPPHLVARLEQK